jgi:hypothetical protein
MAGPATPSGNRHGTLFILERLATGTQHRTMTGWAMHDFLLHGYQVSGLEQLEHRHRIRTVDVG